MSRRIVLTSLGSYGDVYPYIGLAKALTNLGAARTLFPKRYTAARVAAELTPLLEDPAYRTRAQATAGVVRQEGGADAAADAIVAVA